MGRSQAEGFAQAVRDGDIQLEAALHYHLVANHYPPLPATLIPLAKDAITKVNSGEGDSEVSLMRLGYRPIVKTAFQVVEDLHLEAFLDPDDDGDYSYDDDDDDDDSDDEEDSDG